MFFIISFLPTLFFPEDANTPADQFKTPAHIKPEWYFLAPYQMLKLIPNKLLGVSIQMALVAICPLAFLRHKGRGKYPEASSPPHVALSCR